MSTLQAATLAHWFHESAIRHAARPALCVEENHYRYADLLERVQAMASAILRLDPERENPVVGLFAYRSLTAYAGVLGILYAGKGYLPLNPTFPAARNLHIADLAGVTLLIVDRHCEPFVAELLHQSRLSMTVLFPDHEALPVWTADHNRHRCLAQPDIFAARPHILSPQPWVEDLAYLLFTSGSTGVPKGVRVTHGNGNAFVANMLERYQPTPEDRFSQHSDLTFDASVYDMHLCWAAGAALYPVPQKVRMAPARFIQDHALTFWESVPAVIQFMKRMYLLKPGSLPSLRWSVFGGEKLTLEAAQAWQAAAPNARIDNSYGPTEGTVCITGYFWQPGVSEGECRNGGVPIGIPYPGQRTAILVDGRLRAAQEGMQGELCLAGSQVTPGYWRNEEETAKSFVDLVDEAGATGRWYRTGDRVSWQEGVGLHFLDRVDRQLKIRGYRVELAEIEDRLRRIARSDQVVVTGWPAGGENATSVVAFVAGSQRSEEEIRAECAASLPHYMVPRHIQRLAQFPMNANGKTDLRQLIASVQFNAERDGSQGSAPS